MSEEITHPDGRIEHPQVKYEKTDASFGAIFAIVIGSLIFAAFVQYVILLFFVDVRKNQGEAKGFTHPLAPRPQPLPNQEANYSKSGYALPKAPVLEEVDRRAGVERNDVFKRMENYEQALNSYGLTREKAFVHIPIDRAIALMETDGFRLRSRKLPSEEQRRRAGGLVDYGESNSGRVFRRGRQR